MLLLLHPMMKTTRCMAGGWGDAHTTQKLAVKVMQQISAGSFAYPSKWHEALGIGLQRLAGALKPSGWFELMSILPEVLHRKARALYHELHRPALYAKPALFMLTFEALKVDTQTKAGAVAGRIM